MMIESDVIQTKNHICLPEFEPEKKSTRKEMRDSAKKEHAIKIIKLNFEKYQIERDIRRLEESLSRMPEKIVLAEGREIENPLVKHTLISKQIKEERLKEIKSLTQDEENELKKLKLRNNISPKCAESSRKRA